MVRQGGEGGMCGSDWRVSTQVRRGYLSEGEGKGEYLVLVSDAIYTIYKFISSKG